MKGLIALLLLTTAAQAETFEQVVAICKAEVQSAGNGHENFDAFVVRDHAKTIATPREQFWFERCLSRYNYH